MPKLGSAGTIHVSIVKRKRKDGSLYVQEVKSQYDPKTKNSRVISSKTLGILPPGETDISKVVPSDNRPFVVAKRQAQAMADKTSTIADNRKQLQVVYPLDIVMVVILLAGLAGYSSCRQVAEYWNLHRSVFAHWFPHFPDRPISDDTVRSVIKIVGRTNVNDFIEHFTAPLLETFKLRVLAMDGQAVRAASSQEHPLHSRYVLNMYDTDNELCVQQVLIEEKQNEITQAVNLVKSMDLRGAVVTCDALNTQRKLAQFLINTKHCDYCFAVKANQKELFTQVAGWFKTARGQVMAKSVFSEDDGHGRLEERETYVLPAALMKEFHQDVLDKWEGLEDGSIIMARTKRTFANEPEKNSDQTRYFITSLQFDREYIAETMARVIRRHWMVENGLHWTLDVTFGQDRTQCRNADFLAGRTAINKVILNLMSKAQSEKEVETGRQAAYKPSMKVRFSDPNAAMKLLAKLYREEGL